MTYVSWAALYEGPSDRAYFDVLIPRVMEDLTLQHGIRNCTIPPNPAMLLGRGTVEQVAKEACAAKDAFQLVFIHVDTGGRNLESGLDNRSTAYCTAMNETCKWPSARCVVISPRHETEAWILCDPAGVASALGYTGNPIRIGLPASAVQAKASLTPRRHSLMSRERCAEGGVRSTFITSTRASRNGKRSMS